MTLDDLHDTRGCPVGEVCESCGARGRKLAAATATAAAAGGVLCLTLCGPCALAGQTPRLTPLAAARFVAAHCGHLGVTVDDAAEAMEQRA